MIDTFTCTTIWGLRLAVCDHSVCTLCGPVCLLCAGCKDCSVRGQCWVLQCML